MQIPINRRIVIFLILLLTASCQDLKQIYKQRMAELLSPAELVREDLYLTYYKKYVSVKMCFQLRIRRPMRYLTLFFPGKDFPIHCANSKLRLLHPFLSSFKVEWQGKMVPHIYTKQLYSFQINFSKNKLKTCPILTITYTVPYTNYKGRKFFSYVLRTGRVWHGPIGALHIHIDGPSANSMQIKEPYRSNLHLTNIEPVYDFVSEYR